MKQARIQQDDALLNSAKLLLTETNRLHTVKKIPNSVATLYRRKARGRGRISAWIGSVPSYIESIIPLRLRRGN